MPAPAAMNNKEAEPLSFDELDKVKLIKAVIAKGRSFPRGLAGTVVYCHGTEAYEVEFPGIHDFFQIPAGYLEKA